MQYMKENDNILIYLQNLRVFANFRDVRDKQLLDNDANIKINVIDIFCKMFHDDFTWIQYYLDISKNGGRYLTIPSIVLFQTISQMCGLM